VILPEMEILDVLFLYKIVNIQVIQPAHKIYLNFAGFSEGFSINPVKLFKLGIFSDVTPQISGKFYQCRKSYLYFFLLLSHIISNEKQQNLKSHNNILYRKNI